MRRTTRNDPQLRFRIPMELKEWIDKEAYKNHRSVSAHVALMLSNVLEEEAKKEKTDAA